MISVEIGNIRSRILKAKKSQFQAFHTLLSVKAEGAHFMARVRRGHWDGWYRFLSSSTRTFPTGLLTEINSYCKTKGWLIKYRDLRSKPRKIPPLNKITKENFVLGEVEDRDYQFQSVIKALRKHRGILHMATNAGKTVMACAIIKHLNLPTLYLVHTKELLHQTKENIEKLTGRRCGVIGEGILDPRKITVAMVQTLKNKIKNRKFVKEYLKNIDLLIGDEIHHAQSKTWYKIFIKCSAYFRYGLSATPFTKDRASNFRLIGATGRVLVRVRNDFLIKRGYSALPKVTMYNFSDRQPADHTYEISYQKAYKNFIVENKVRNKMITSLANKLEGTTLIIVLRIQHGNLLLSKIKDGIFVSGQSTNKFRRKIAKRIRSGKALKVVATTIYDEGVDFPAINNLILACGGGAKSERQILQRIGRGLRRKEKGKENVLYVYDFFDHTNKYLKRHSRNRLKYYKEEKFSVLRERFVA